MSNLGNIRYHQFWNLHNINFDKRFFRQFSLMRFSYNIIVEGSFDEINWKFNIRFPPFIQILGNNRTGLSFCLREFMIIKWSKELVDYVQKLCRIPSIFSKLIFFNNTHRPNVIIFLKNVIIMIILSSIFQHIIKSSKWLRKLSYNNCKEEHHQIDDFRNQNDY